MITMNSNSTHIWIYVNGTREGVNGAVSGEYDSAEQVFRLGAHSVNVADSFDGIGDEAFVKNQTCSQAEIDELWANGAGLQYPFTSDSCSCPGLVSNWEIDMSDYCNITSDCNLGAGTLSFEGSGTTRINSTINTTGLGEPGANGILKILDSCRINVN